MTPASPETPALVTDLLACFGRDNRLRERLAGRLAGVYGELAMSRVMRRLVKDKRALVRATDRNVNSYVGPVAGSGSGGATVTATGGLTVSSLLESTATADALLANIALIANIGAITGNSSRAKKYAGAGAATGALVGGSRKRDTQRRQREWEQQQQQQYRVELERIEDAAGDRNRIRVERLVHDFSSK